MYQNTIDVRSLIPRPEFGKYVQQKGFVPISEAQGKDLEWSAHLLNRGDELTRWIAARFGVDVTGRIVSDDKVYHLNNKVFEQLAMDVYDYDPSMVGYLEAAHLPSGHIIVRNAGKIRERVVLDHERLHGVFGYATDFPVFEEGLVRILTTEYINEIPESAVYKKGISEYDMRYYNQFTRLFEIMHKRSKTELDYCEFVEQVYVSYLDQHIDIPSLIAQTLGEEFIEFALYVKDLNDLEIFMQNFDEYIPAN